MENLKGATNEPGVGEPGRDMLPQLSRASALLHARGLLPQRSPRFLRTVDRAGFATANQDFRSSETTRRFLVFLKVVLKWGFFRHHLEVSTLRERESLLN